MRLSHTHSWTCTLLLCYTLFPGSPAKSDLAPQTVYAQLGHSAALTCKVDGSIKVVQSQWSRCPNLTILVFHMEHKDYLSDKRYKGHVSITEYHTLTLQRVQQEDFGEYCCKLTTYPSGSLEGRVHLLEDKERKDASRKISGATNTTTPVSFSPQPAVGLPVMMMVYIGCGSVGVLVLMGIIIVLLCRKRRRRSVRNPAVPGQASAVPPNVPTGQKSSLTHTHRKGAPANVCNEDDEEDEDDADMYLNVPNIK
ncbi:uncharacterized protein [Salminus brasiliensis]|uniref:uncharacterized protein isoform X1 n=1 Tax=Salminus brasiliensis TaxID=930266 RepID=UPI003B835397